MTRQAVQAPFKMKRAAGLSLTRHLRKLRERHAAAQGGRCIYCGAPFDDARPATLEHIQPRSKGGGDTAANTAASCLPCNQERGTRHHEAFRRFKARGA